MKRLEGKFQGWAVDETNGVMFDEGGNEYDMHEIRAIFMTRQWMYSHVGGTSNVLSLKEELERKVKAMQMPKVIIDWGDAVQELSHPKY